MIDQKWSEKMRIKKFEKKTYKQKKNNAKNN